MCEEETQTLTENNEIETQTQATEMRAILTQTETAD